MGVNFVKIFIYCHLCCIGSLFFEIPEESKAGTFVGKIEQVDSENAIFFKLTTDMDSSYFAVNRNDGEIITVSVIKRESLLRCREQIDCLVTFKIASTSKNGLKIHKITVNILDVNNNPPTFSPDYIFIELTRNGAPNRRIELPTPYDYDSPKNGIKNCFIHPSIKWAKLSIGGKTKWELALIINTTKVTNPRQTIQIQCKDEDHTSGTLNVEVSKKRSKLSYPPKFDYKTIKISVPLLDNSEWLYITTLHVFKQSENISFRSLSSLSLIRFGLVKYSANFKVDPKNGSVFAHREHLLHIDASIHINVSACYQDLCDYCEIFIEPKIPPNFSPKNGADIKLIVSSAREDGFLIVETSSLTGTNIAYAVVESAIEGNVTCRSENPEFATFQPLNSQSFVLVTGVSFESNYSLNDTQCLTIECDIDKIAYKRKQVCITLNNSHTQNTKNTKEYGDFVTNGSEIHRKSKNNFLRRLYFEVMGSILSIMFLIFALYMILRCYRSNVAKKLNKKIPGNLSNLDGEVLPLLQNKSVNECSLNQKVNVQTRVNYIHETDEFRGYNSSLLASFN